MIASVAGGGLELLQERVEPGVALDQAGVEEGVAVLEALDERLRGEPRAAVAEILEPVRLEDDEVGRASGENVCTISSFGITSWNDPWTLPSISGPDIVMRYDPPVRQSNWSNGT